MKKLLALVLALVMMVGLSACGGSGKDGSSAKKTTMTMGTGGTAGTYYGYGGILGTQIKNESGITVKVVSTDGSKTNILGIDTGDYQLATVQSDVMAYACDGSRSFEVEGKIDTFRVIGGLYAEAVQLLTMNPDIKTVADLKGKKVSIGAAGSGVYFNAIDILAAAGLKETDIKPQYQSFAESADALKDGKIDAAFIVAGPPTPAIQELCTTSKAYLIPIDGVIAEKLMEDSPYYTTFKIPANTYNGQTEDVTTVTVKATLIVSKSATEDDVYEITKSIFDNIDDIKEAHAKGSELSLQNATDGMTAPFHPGAIKYFAEKGITVK
ncbi:MAG: TAXI family TRAP transporter solute-binding subunit [Ruminococcaceae bacterium]|nr:TAXI family TRAP transporter solute-binding subunit [Oscillospiraceae bacterium]